MQHAGIYKVIGPEKLKNEVLGKINMAMKFYMNF